MAIFNISECPVCDNDGFASYLICKDYFVSSKEFKIKECKKCGFKITENIQDEDNIGSYYQSEEYISHSNTSKGVVNRLYHSVRNYMLGRKRRLVEKVSGIKNGRLLDVGSGTGFFLYEMKEKGWQVTGTEKSEDARVFAKKEFNLQQLPTNELFQLKNNSFDVITLWHVLEHIHKLPENMQTFNHLLNETGKLIIAVPNNDSYDAKHYQKFWAAYDVPRHIWHFAPKQMQLLGKKFGFKLESLHTMPFDSFYVSMLSEKYKKSSFGLIKGLFHGKISWIKSWFNKGKCSSVIYVFSKN